MATNQQLSIALRIQADLAEAQNALRQLTGNLQQVDRGAVQTRSELSAMGGQLDSLRAQVLGFVGAWASLSALGGLVTMVDQYGQMADRIQMVTSSTAEYEQVQARLLETASRTYRPLAEAQELYIRTADSLKSLRYTTEQALDITDSFSFLLVTNAASADRAASAIDAYSKSIQTGKVSSDAWQSIMAAMPSLVNALAESTGKSTEEIRKLGIEGSLSLRDLNEGLRKTVAANREAADNMGTSVQDALVSLNSALSAYLGELNRTYDITGSVSSALNVLAENMEVIVKLFGVAAVAGLTRYVASLTLATQAKLAAVLAARAQVAEELRAAQAQVASTAAAAANARAQAGLTVSHAQAAAAEAAHTAATQRLAAAQLAAGTAMRGMLAVIGGPAGIAMLVAGAAASFFLFRDSAQAVKSSLDDLSEPLDQVVERMGKLSEIEQDRELTRLSEQIDGLRQTAVEAAREMREVASTALYGARLDRIPSAEAQQALQPLIDASADAARGVEVDWKSVMDSLAASGAVPDSLKRKLLDMAAGQAEAGRTATELGQRHAELKARLEGSTAAINENSDALSKGSDKAAEYIQSLRLAIADLEDPSVLGKAGRRLQQFGADLNAEQSAEILRLETLKANTEKAAQAREDARRKAESSARQQASTAEQLAKSQEGYVAGLEKQARTLGLTSAEVRAYELAEKGLTGALQARAAAALAALAADEKKRQADATARTNAGLEAEYLRATGRIVDAGLLEIRTKFDAMRRDFEKAGNDAGLAWIDKLIPVAEAKVRLDDVKQQMDDLLADQQRAESSVNVQQDAGVINEMDARQRILDIHRATYEKLQQIRPILEQMARQPGEVGRAAAESLAQLDAEAARLQQTTTLLETTLRDGLTSGFTDAIKGLASGTMDLRDAITSLGEAVLNALVNMAAQNLAQSLSSGIMGLFGGGQQDTSMTTGAAAVTASAGALSTAGASLLTGAAAIQTAAASLAAANGVQGLGAAAGGAGAAGAAAGGGSWWSSIAGVFGFATGGHIKGPGTGTSDSIPILASNDEFMTRAAVVRQPGALAFLEQFNRYGMAALAGWANPVRHATGGQIGIPAPNLPAPVRGGANLPEPSKNFSASVSNAVHLHAVQDPDQMAADMWAGKGGDHYIVWLNKNRQAVKQILGN
ncbi:tail length tape measure protein [Pseudomonas aeruginosa]|uniref:tape measure protein n=1 Tax=Pseudomonas aeruginosa TaxID=287 RepID=UPI0007724AD6|nr:tape measure protein [Pseudomonas aeruginosa]KXF25266.1 tail length tape measure protein [Pseudomonas aeruginosa]